MGGFKRAVEENLVFFFHLIAWVGECEGEIAIVGDHEEAFAFFVEASDVVDTRPIVRDEIENGASTGLIGGRADETFGFVDDCVNVLLGFDGPVTDFDDIPGGNGGGEGGDDLSVDADGAFRDEGFDGASGSKSGGGEVTIQAHPATRTDGRLGVERERRWSCWRTLTNVDPAGMIPVDERARFPTDADEVGAPFEACLGAGGCFCGSFGGVAGRFGEHVWHAVADGFRRPCSAVRDGGVFGFDGGILGDAAGGVRGVARD